MKRNTFSASVSISDENKRQIRVAVELCTLVRYRNLWKFDFVQLVSALEYNESSTRSLQLPNAIKQFHANASPKRSSLIILGSLQTRECSAIPSTAVRYFSYFLPPLRNHLALPPSRDAILNKFNCLTRRVDREPEHR